MSVAVSVVLQDSINSVVKIRAAAVIVCIICAFFIKLIITVLFRNVKYAIVGAW